MYVEGGAHEALADSCSKLQRVISDIRQNAGAVVDVVIVVGFNRRD